MQLKTSEFLTQNELDAAKLVMLDELNVQSQPKYTWPAAFVVARAYLDQLERSKALAADRLESTRKALADAEAATGPARTKALVGLTTLAVGFQKDAVKAKGADTGRFTQLAATLKALK